MIRAPEPEEPYRDEAFVISIEDGDVSQSPPPSYEDLYVEDRNQSELQTLMGDVDMDREGHSAEEVCKFIVVMLLLALTVACVATAFHWGRLGEVRTAVD